MTWPFVLCLFFSCCPAAITRLVMPIVIDSFNCKISTRTRTHIAQKCFKAIIPSLTNCNSPATIIRKILVLRIKTALPHLLPNVVFRSFRSSVSIPNCVAIAATTLKFGQMRFLNTFLGATLTLAHPATMAARLVWHAVQNGEHTKFLSGQIFYNTHGETIQENIGMHNRFVRSFL